MRDLDHAPINAEGLLIHAEWAARKHGLTLPDGWECEIIKFRKKHYRVCELDLLADRILETLRQLAAPQ